jgi:hypothetical protein
MFIGRVRRTRMEKKSLRAASTRLPSVELHGSHTRSVVRRPPIARANTCSLLPGRSLRQKMHRMCPRSFTWSKAGSARGTQSVERREHLVEETRRQKAVVVPVYAGGLPQVVARPQKFVAFGYDNP